MTIDQTTEYLKERWNSFTTELSIGCDPDPVFEILSIHHNSPERAYHNFTHIKNMFTEFDGVKHLSEHPQELEMAIWFHDMIYNTKAKDNEEQSAREGYNATLAMRLPEYRAKKVSDLIMATKHVEEPRNIDEQLMIDIDLSILGKPRDEFDVYEAAIRQEYAWVPEEDYRKGRTEILQRFLDRDHIYSTDHFRERYETQARENIAQSIQMLNGVDEVTQALSDMPDVNIDRVAERFTGDFNKILGSDK